MTTPPPPEGLQPGLVQLCLFDPGTTTLGMHLAGGHPIAVDHTDTTPTPETRHT